MNQDQIHVVMLGHKMHRYQWSIGTPCFTNRSLVTGHATRGRNYVSSTWKLIYSIFWCKKTTNSLIYPKIYLPVICFLEMFRTNMLLNAEAFENKRRLLPRILCGQETINPASRVTTAINRGWLILRHVCHNGHQTGTAISAQTLTNGHLSYNAFWHDFFIGSSYRKTSAIWVTKKQIVCYMSARLFGFRLQSWIFLVFY